MEDHAKKIVKDPNIAIVELVANCWDAGADTVKITWPSDSSPEPIVIEDNGTGMSLEEFYQRWRHLNYNRIQYQGTQVTFPEGNRSSNRTAYGRNGKGRHSMFCFANEYEVTTWQNGEYNRFKVKRISLIHSSPFEIVHIDQGQKDGHGTIISAILGKNYLPLQEVHDLIGTKFITDPTFQVFLNGIYTEFTSLEHLTDVRFVKIPKIGEVKISQVDTKKTSRSSQPHGVAWWVNRRLVGDVSWKDFSEELLVDRRTVEGRRYTFIVEADLLGEGDNIEEDWSGFKETTKFVTIQKAVKNHIHLRLKDLLKDIHQSRKRKAISANKDKIAKLPLSSRHYVDQTVDGLQEKIPSIKPGVLSKVIDAIVTLEQARSGFALLEQISKLNSEDVDALNEILEKWSVQEARLVLGELERRLKLIEHMEKIVEDSSSDELHDIHPLFETGLWIFGPEYESVHFTSNRSLKTVITKLLGSEDVDQLSTPRRRPDLVALPKSSIEVYSSESFDEDSEVDGYDKILIVELKRGSHTLRLKDQRQGEDYSYQLRKSGKVQDSTIIKVYVLGTFIDPEIQKGSAQGDNTKVIPMTYSVIIKRAKARTFYLSEKIKSIKEKELYDFELEKVMKSDLL